MRDYALEYIANEFPVIPLCWPNNGQCSCGREHTDKAIGKVPLTPRGLKDATITIQGVSEYWHRWPQANIGIVIPPGYFVLDVDTNGFDSLIKMEQDIGVDLPSTWLVITGSGGHHYWYKTNKPIRNTTRLAGYDGLDVRGIGGYCVAPPSQHRNGQYYTTSPEWQGPIVEAPEALINLCTQRQSTTNPALSDKPLAEGVRNDTLARNAGAMRRRGFSEEAIYAALQITNQQRCLPPLPDKDILSIAQSIGRYVPEPAERPRFKGGV